MHFGGWTRIGIIASVIWAAGAYFYSINVDYSHRDRYVSVSYRLCSEDLARQEKFNYSSCMDKAWTDGQAFTKHSTVNAAILAFFPIPIGWLTVLAIIGVVRWTRAGFIRKSLD
jgi:hypothetical protein